MNALLIFDFDGVIGDTEVIANRVLAEVVTELGCPTSLEDAYERYMGKRAREVMEAIGRDIGGTVPEGLDRHLQERTFQRFRAELDIVPGVRAFIDGFAEVPKCIASSSSPDRLELCLRTLDLHDVFAGRVYSAAQVPRGKPHPDIFLFAANQVGIEPARCIVIEDSPSGVQAAVAAGMIPVGLLAGAHICAGHGERLTSAGAERVFDSFDEAKVFTEETLLRLSSP